MIVNPSDLRLRGSLSRDCRSLAGIGWVAKNTGRMELKAVVQGSFQSRVSTISDVRRLRTAASLRERPPAKMAAQARVPARIPSNPALRILCRARHPRCAKGRFQSSVLGVPET